MEQYKLDQSRAIQRLAQSQEQIAEELSSINYTLNQFFKLLLKEKNDTQTRGLTYRKSQNQ